MGIKIDTETKQALDDYYKWEKEHYEECRIHNNSMIEEIRKNRGDLFIDSLLDVMTECEISGEKYRFVEKPKGEYQREQYGVIQGIYVDQYSVGESGDSWSGTITIKISNNKYLEMGFSM